MSLPTKASSSPANAAPATQDPQAVLMPTWAPPELSATPVSEWTTSDVVHFLWLSEARLRAALERRSTARASGDQIAFTLEWVSMARDIRRISSAVRPDGPFPKVVNTVHQPHLPFSDKYRYPVGEELPRSSHLPTDLGGNQWWARWLPVPEAQTAAASSESAAPKQRPPPAAAQAAVGNTQSSLPAMMSEEDLDRLYEQYVVAPNLAAKMPSETSWAEEDPAAKVTEQFAKDLGLPKVDPAEFEPVAGYPHGDAVEHLIPCHSCSRKRVRCVGMAGRACLVCLEGSHKKCGHTDGIADDKWREIPDEAYNYILHKVPALKDVWKKLGPRHEGKGKRKAEDGSKSTRKRQRGADDTMSHVEMLQRIDSSVLAINHLTDQVIALRELVGSMITNISRRPHVDQYKEMSEKLGMDWDTLVAETMPSGSANANNQ
ncbi:hypothetical protein CONPUDRAFT_150881 [Coniophora puteana RWD-64-598 SS2]|uniref:Uncharacterized protein n=1 Tax=Coniophora puteana (strain RWD-64-598) TaxID=741705 RepID=A0A5M3MXD8_CONPW|nr:uncharacterized protein CONPUDRAFT_150881 [Coniophora puteana RWD-64-598 SS2]EIW83829.1 hypothetical protein CONPUDRAFT_150881 [Coniophora puteana RWD-64-598 SS2]